MQFELRNRNDWLHTEEGEVKVRIFVLLLLLALVLILSSDIYVSNSFRHS